MICNKRFKSIADKYGFRIKKTSSQNFNEKGQLLSIVRRPDILSVQYHNRHVMTIPKKMYAFVKKDYKPLGWDKPHPDFFNLEHQLKNWNLIIKRQPNDYA